MINFLRPSYLCITYHGPDNTWIDTYDIFVYGYFPCNLYLEGKAKWSHGLDKDATNVFYIRFSSYAAFQHYDIVNLIPPDILEHIHDKKAFLILDCSWESDIRNTESIYLNVVEKGIPASQIILVSGGFGNIHEIEKYSEINNVEKIRHIVFNSPECIFANHLRNNYSKEELTTIPHGRQPNKLFICLNRYLKLHRVLFYNLLFNRGLLNDGHISMTKVSEILGGSFEKVS